MPLFRQRTETLGQEGRLTHFDRQLSRARSEDLPLDTDPVAQVQGAVELPPLLADRVLADIELEPRGPVGQVEEPGLSLVSLGEDPAGRPDSRRELLQVLRRHFPVPPDDVGNRIGQGIIERIDVRKLADAPEIVQPVLDKVSLGGSLFLRRGLCALVHPARKYATPAWARRSFRFQVSRSGRSEDPWNLKPEMRGSAVRLWRVECEPERGSGVEEAQPGAGPAANLLTRFGGGLAGAGEIGERAVELRSVGECRVRLSPQIIRDPRASALERGLGLVLGLDPQRRGKDQGAVALRERLSSNQSPRGVRLPGLELPLRQIPRPFQRLDRAVISEGGEDRPQTGSPEGILESAERRFHLCVVLLIGSGFECAEHLQRLGGRLPDLQELPPANGALRDLPVELAACVFVQAKRRRVLQRPGGGPVFELFDATRGCAQDALLLLIEAAEGGAGRQVAQGRGCENLGVRQSPGNLTLEVSQALDPSLLRETAELRYRGDLRGDLVELARNLGRRVVVNARPGRVRENRVEELTDFAAGSLKKSGRVGAAGRQHRCEVVHLIQQILVGLRVGSVEAEKVGRNPRVEGPDLLEVAASERRRQLDVHRAELRAGGVEFRLQVGKQLRRRLAHAGVRRFGETLQLFVEGTEIDNASNLDWKESPVNPLEELVEGRKRLEPLRQPDIVSLERLRFRRH